MRSGSGGRGWGGGGGAFAQGTNLCVYVPLQNRQGDKYSALHFASTWGLKSVVAQMLSLGADAALEDNVRACSYMSTLMYSVLVCTFVNALLIRVSLFLLHIIQAYHVCMYYM